jgi:hypothetical protein
MPHEGISTVATRRKRCAIHRCCRRPDNEWVYWTADTWNGQVKLEGVWRWSAKVLEIGIGLQNKLTGIAQQRYHGPAWPSPKGAGSGLGLRLSQDKKQDVAPKQFARHHNSKVNHSERVQTTSVGVLDRGSSVFLTGKRMYIYVLLLVCGCTKRVIGCCQPQRSADLVGAASTSLKNCAGPAVIAIISTYLISPFLIFKGEGIEPGPGG